MQNRFLSLAVALIANAVSLGIAHAQSVTTLDPSFFTPGTDISNVFSGVTLSAVTLVPNGTNAEGRDLLTPSFAPVYADGALFSSQSSPPFPDDWGGTFFLTTDPCFDGCVRSSPPFFGTNLLISFSTPVDMVTALQLDNPFNGVFMQAFDSSNQLIGECLPASFSPQPQGNYGCYSVLNNNSNPCGNNVSCQYTTSISAPDISKVILGGYNMPDQIGAVQYETVRAPEIDPASAASGVTLLLGGLLVLRGRRPKLDGFPA